MTEQVDDRTAAYAAVTLPCFEDLKQAAAQIAGLLVLAAAGSSAAAPDHPLITAAAQVQRQAEDALRSARVSKAARVHYEYLSRASAKLARVLSVLGAGRDALPLLEGVYADLRAASRALPGFQMLDFERGCCGPHRAQAVVR
ncbi:MAG TPA: hypothetical protein VG297_20355 [Bryobacteraceae bacterium]|jgi:hypothetical protein|nr:hypothetical protein [Bryobacteraceae bacterium]